MEETEKSSATIGAGFGLPLLPLRPLSGARSGLEKKDSPTAPRTVSPSTSVSPPPTPSRFTASQKGKGRATTSAKPAQDAPPSFTSILETYDRDEIELLAREEDEPAPGAVGSLNNLAPLAQLASRLSSSVAKIHRVIAKTMTSPQSDLIALSTILSAIAETTSSQPFPTSHPVLVELAGKPNLLKCILELSKNPYSFDPAPFVANGALVKSAVVDEEIVTQQASLFQAYLRLWVFESQEAMLDAVRGYVQSYPGDSFFLAAVEAECARDPHAHQLPYEGIAVANTPSGRIVQDTGSEGSRIKNFGAHVSTLERPPKLAVFEFVNFRQLATTEDFLHKPLLSQIEIVLVAATYHRSLNRALGGSSRAWSWKIADDLVRLVDAGEVSHATLDATLPLAASASATFARTQRDVKFHFQDFLQYLQQQKAVDAGSIGYLLEEGTIGGAAALAQTIEDGAPSRSRMARGEIEVILDVLLTKDVTRQGLQGVTTFFGPKAAPATRVFDLVQSTITHLQPLCCPPRSDFWVFCTRHLLVIIHIFFFGRYLHLLAPRFIATRASKTYHILASGLLNSCLIPGDALNEFFRCDVPSTLDKIKILIELVAIEIVWEDTPCPDWPTWIGTAAVVVYGPRATDVAILVPLIDEGLLHHDPTLAEFLEPVVFLSSAIAHKAKLMLAAKLAAVGPPSGTREEVLTWNRDLKKEIELEVTRLGWRTELERARDLAIGVWKGLSGARAKAGIERKRLAIEKNEGISREEVLRREGAAMSERRLAMDGPRFEGSSINTTDLAPFFDAADVFDPSLVPATETRPRVLQLAKLLHHHNEQQLNGAPSDLPLIASTSPGSREYVAWFVEGTEGAEYRRSAAQKGATRTPRVRTEEEAARFHRTKVEDQARVEREKREKKGISNPMEGEVIDSLQKLAGETFVEGVKKNGLNSRQQFCLFECSDCCHGFIGALDKFQHLCSSNGGRKSMDRLTRTRILFPHYFIDKGLSSGWLSSEQLADVLDRTGLVAVGAREVLARLAPAILAIVPATSTDPSIYVLSSTSDDLKVAMAVDALILALAPVDDVGSDDRAWNAGVRGHDESVRKLCHRENVIVKVLECGKDGCDYSTTRVLKPGASAQHRCGATDTQSTTYSTSREAATAWQIPQPLLRHYAFAFFDGGDALVKSVKGVGVEDLLGWTRAGLVAQPKPAKGGKKKGGKRGG